MENGEVGGLAQTNHPKLALDVSRSGASRLRKSHSLQAEVWRSDRLLLLQAILGKFIRGL